MSRRKALRRKPIDAVALDATPERIAKGDFSHMVNPAEIDSSEQPIGLTRRFRSSRIDTLYRNGRLTERGRMAGLWLEMTCERAAIRQKLTANMEPRTGGNVFFAFLPMSESQERARELRDWALSTMELPMRGFMLRLCQWNELPSRHDKSGQRTVKELCDTLERLADDLRIPG